MNVAVGTQSSITFARIQWSAPSRDPLLHEVTDQFATVELALSLSRLVAEATAQEDRKTSAFSPIVDLEQVFAALTQVREWASYNEQVARLIDGIEASEAALSSNSPALDALRAVRAEKRNASRRAVRQLVHGGSEYQSKWINNLVGATVGAVKEAELRNDEAISKTVSLLRSPRRADLQEAELSSCKELARSASSSSGIAREMAEHAWEYSKRAVPGYSYDPVRRLAYESPIELTVVITGSIGAFVAVLDHLLGIRIKFKTRDAVEEAERARLEREISEDETAKLAIERLRRHLENRDSTDLGIQEVVVSDDEFDMGPD